MAEILPHAHSAIKNFSHLFTYSPQTPDIPKRQVRECHGMALVSRSKPI